MSIVIFRRKDQVADRLRSHIGSAIARMGVSARTPVLGVFSDETACERARLSQALQSVFGMRVSDRLFCAEAILGRYRDFPFTRSDVVHSFHRAFSVRTIDRTLLLLEAHGIVRGERVSEESGQAGAVYRACPASAWHAYDESIVRARHNRHGATVARLGKVA